MRKCLRFRERESLSLALSLSFSFSLSFSLSHTHTHEHFLVPFFHFDALPPAPPLLVCQATCVSMNILFNINSIFNVVFNFQGLYFCCTAPFCFLFLPIPRTRCELTRPYCRYLTCFTSTNTDAEDYRSGRRHQHPTWTPERHARPLHQSQTS
jgi:hypothetical protein